MIRRLVRFVRREDGPTQVSNALILAIIVVVCIAAVGLLGRSVEPSFHSAQSRLGEWLWRAAPASKQVPPASRPINAGSDAGR